MKTSVSVVDPLTDVRWDELLQRHPRASVFHAPGWLAALKRTYGYEPFVLAVTRAGTMTSGIPFCRVRTLLARRLVSLPFSDHCDPLVEDPSDLAALIRCAEVEAAREGCRTLELRPRSLVPDGLAESSRFAIHSLDLARPIREIFDSFHPSNTRRTIRRAEREGLTCTSGRTEWFLDRFFSLLRLTRRRHGLPPQPREWFRNLAACFGDQMSVHLASKNDEPVAGMVTLTFKNTIVYKYGGSDASQHALGAMPFLFWYVIRHATTLGLQELDLGRSDLDNAGLIAFKDHLGSKRSTVTYFCHPARRPERPHAGVVARAARWVLPRLPDSALDLTGRLLYKHLG